MRFRSQLGSFLNTLHLVNEGVEVGVSTGQFSRQILRIWKGKKLWLVDPWQHLYDYFDSFNASDTIMERRFILSHHKLSKWAPKLGWLRKRSKNAVSHFKDVSLDFVYIDANHSYGHTLEDLRLWYPKVKRGGLFAGHDYFDAQADNHLEPILSCTDIPSRLTSYGVKSAVDEFTRKINVKFNTTIEKYPTWYFLKY